MIRFTPDTVLDALMRPIAMAAPNAWVYIEILAPDFRFAILMLLAMAGAVASVRHGWRSKPTWLLLGFVALSFVPWLYTTGNGRYFIPMLLAAGPLVVALAYHLPVTRWFKASLGLLAIAVQGVALMANSPWKPWDSWEMVRWREAPYFQVDLPSGGLEPHATYVTISSISFSLLAPQFPPTSRWINLTTQASSNPQSIERRRTQAFLQSATDLRLLLPSVPTSMTPNLQPDHAAAQSIDNLLAGQQLALRKPVACTFLHSSSLQEMSLVKANDDAQTQAETARRVGFWVCPLAYSAAMVTISPGAAQVGAAAAKAELALRKLEQLCPRFFAPGQIGTQPMEGGRKRYYPWADMQVYVLDEGSIYYKYERSLNPHKFATADGLLSGAETPECKIRGRSGLPWDREI